MFDKYLRAITDEKERKEILTLLRARIASMAVAVAALIALVVESIVFDGMLENGENAPLWPGYVTIALFDLGIIGYFVLGSVFRSKFNFILRRKPREGEPEELTAYRKNLLEERMADREATRKYSKFTIAGLVLFGVLLVAETFLYPEKEELGALSLTGLGLFAAGMAISLVLYVIYDSKKKRNKDKVSADVYEKLDEIQGREHRYSISEDKNAQSLKYLFPTPELREKAEKYKKNYSLQLLSSVLVSAMMAFCTVCVFCFGKVLEINLSGYAYPIFVGMVLILTSLASIQPLHRISKVEKEQLKELKEKPEYAKNLQIYRLYEEFSRVKGKTVVIAAVLSILVSLIIAVFVPDEPWSALCLFVLIGGLMLYNKFYASLRLSVIPLEKEIEAAIAEKEVVSEGRGEESGFFSGLPQDGEKEDDDLKF